MGNTNELNVVFKAGDVVEKINGKCFSSGRLTATVSRTEAEGDRVWLSTCGSRLETWTDKEDLQLVLPAPQQAFKADLGKPNWFLLMSRQGCAEALAGVVRVLTFAVTEVAQGGKGYIPHSWRQVPDASERYQAALYRHLNKLALGEELDDESGESHWSHVAANALFLSELNTQKTPGVPE